MITLPLMFLICYGVVGQALAQTRVPGVTPGDNLIYSITSSWNTSNSSAIVPPFLVGLNNTRNYNVTVTYVSGENVTALNTLSFKNGTADINSLVTVETGTGQVLEYIPGLPAFQGFYVANLQVNDPLYPGNLTLPFWINQTTTHDYASGKRDTNVVEYSYSVENIFNVTGTETQTLSIDKATGVLVDRKTVSVFPDQSGTQFWNLTSTNLWSVSSTPVELPLPWPIIVVIVAAVIVVVVAAAYFRGNRRRRRKSKR